MSNLEAMENMEEKMEVNEAPAYTLRPLKDKDVWPVVDILSKVFPDDLGAIFAQIMTGERNVEQLGAMVVVRLVTAVLKNVNKVRNEVYALLADVSGIPAEEIEEMEFGTSPMMIWEIANNARNASFFKVVSKFF
jgi:uncharacterized protein YdbL (DUF1318 family)